MNTQDLRNLRILFKFLNSKLIVLLTVRSNTRNVTLHEFLQDYNITFSTIANLHFTPFILVLKIASNKSMPSPFRFLLCLRQLFPSPVSKLLFVLSISNCFVVVILTIFLVLIVVLMTVVISVIVVVLMTVIIPILFVLLFSLIFVLLSSQNVCTRREKVGMCCTLISNV